MGFNQPPKSRLGVEMGCGMLGQPYIMASIMLQLTAQQHIVIHLSRPNVLVRFAVFE